MARPKKTPTSKNTSFTFESKPAITNFMPNQNTTSAYSLASTINFINNNFAVFFIATLFFVGGFFIGSLWTENQFLKNGGLAGKGAAAPTAAAPTEPSGPTPEQLKKVAGVAKDDHIRGNKNAKVTLVEFSDFECPYCAQFHPTMLKVKEEYGDKIQWIYRHYPLSFHPHAQKAAEASECIYKQKGDEAFWEFSDKIFAENTKLQGRFTDDTVMTVAGTVTGINATALKTCVDGGEMAERVARDLNDGTAAGITGTPGTIILTDDGQAELIPGALPFEQVKPMLDKYVN